MREHSWKCGPPNLFAVSAVFEYPSKLKASLVLENCPYCDCDERCVCIFGARVGAIWLVLLRSVQGSPKPEVSANLLHGFVHRNTKSAPAAY